MINEQLAALDAAATQGVWVANIGHTSVSITADGSAIASCAACYPECCCPIEEGDAVLIAALVNAYRAGQLVVRTEPSEADVDRVARALAADDGLDYDEVCGADADPDEGYCDSGTCVAAHHQDHESEFAREWYYKLARAAIAAMVR